MTGRERPKLASKTLLTWRFALERVTGIEPALSAWEADVLPLNYTRGHLHCLVTAVGGRVCAVFAQTSYRTR
jgi:hypothetical protein